MTFGIWGPTLGFGARFQDLGQRVRTRGKIRIMLEFDSLIFLENSEVRGHWQVRGHNEEGRIPDFRGNVEFCGHQQEFGHQEKRP